MPIYVHRSITRKHPLIELRMFKSRTVWSAVLANAIMSAAGTAVWIVYPLLMVQRWHWSLPRVGLSLTPIPISAGLAAIGGARLARRFGSRAIVGLGSLFLVFGMTWLAFRLTTTPHYVSVLLVGGLAFNIGFGLTFAPLNAAALTGVPEEQLGQATAAFSTLRQLVVGLGVALVVGLLGNATPISMTGFRHAFVALAALSALTGIVVATCVPRSATGVLGDRVGAVLGVE
jgi:MFS family permease